MNFLVPDISKQIYKQDIHSVLENKYSVLGPIWVSNQMEWNNTIYASFKDHDKYLIIIFLIKKTLDFYSSNFTKLTFDQFYSKETVEIERYSISEISIALKIPKETARRKVLELEDNNIIKRIKKKIIIDRSKFHFSRPDASIKRISRFLSTFSEMCTNENILPKKITTDELEKIIKKNFSYIWKLYYELQIPMMIRYKETFKDLETFHIWGTCIVNQHLFAKKISEDTTSRTDFIKTVYTTKKMQGLNAMSISDITGIPRATVIRKLKKLVKNNSLKIDEKKHYRLTGNLVNKLMASQNEILIRLSNFSTKIFNLQQL